MKADYQQVGVDLPLRHKAGPKRGMPIEVNEEDRDFLALKFNERRAR